MAADGVTGGAAAPVVAGAASAEPAPASSQPAEVVAAPPVASEIPAAPVAAPVAEAKPPESTPSLLEAASGKPEAAEPAKDIPDASKDAKAEKTGETSKEVKPEPAQVEAAKDDAAKPDPAKEATAEVKPPAAMTYEPFKAPDGVKLGDKELKAFTDVIGPAQVPQEQAQQLVDLYLAETQRLQADAQKQQREHWNTLNDTWKSDLRKDPDLGGNRLETSLSIAKAVIEEYGGTPEQKAELMAHTTNNGMGNYAGFIRLLHNIGTKLNVFEDKIVPANAVNPNMPKTRADRLYGPAKGNGAAA